MLTLLRDVSSTVSLRRFRVCGARLVETDYLVNKFREGEKEGGQGEVQNWNEKIKKGKEKYSQIGGKKKKHTYATFSRTKYLDMLYFRENVFVETMK